MSRAPARIAAASPDSAEPQLARALGHLRVTCSRIESVEPSRRRLVADRATAELVRSVEQTARAGSWLSVEAALMRASAEPPRSGRALWAGACRAALASVLAEPPGHSTLVLACRSCRAKLRATARVCGRCGALTTVGIGAGNG